MEEDTIKVKTEKIDPEIEQKIKEHLNVKEEPVDDQESNDSSSSSQSNVQDEPEEKKNVEVAKSSNELLTELFQVFNVAPPEELLNDENLIKKAKQSKKTKKEKRKKHKKHKNIEVTDEADPDEINLNKKEKHKHKKKKKHKNKRDEKDKERKRSKSKDKEKVKVKTEQTQHKPKEHNKHNSVDREDKDRLNKKSHTSSVITKEKEGDLSKKHEESRSRKRHATEDKTNEPPSKIKFNIEKREKHVHNSYYNGGISERNESFNDSKSREDKLHDNKLKDHHIKVERTNRSSERNSHRDNNSNNNRRHQHSRERLDRNELSDLSLSDEETYLRERARPTENRRREHNYQNIRNRRNLDHHRRRTPNQTHQRTRSRSRSRDLGIDKKRLLEIARKNAISMFKRGSLPGCANMTEDVKDKVLLQMRYGGRTVQDLTEFCRKISNGEPLPELSSDNDSDIDRDGNTKPFHHPFQVKDRDPIVLQIRNAIPQPITARKEEQTKAITMQFPVSSGQQHRMSESWIPVESNPTSLPPLPTATQSTTIFKQTIRKNVFEKALPAAEQQEPAFKPLNVSGTEPDSTVTTEVVCNTTISTATTTTVATLTATSTQVTSSFIPDVPIPSSTTSESVFPEVNSTSVDVSSIISKRLNALRRLQENPMDSEAIKMMYNSQKEMSSWASSKHIPGQFTGSTGANILTVHELNSGPQIRIRRDQLTSTKPVTGGMGMHLLQKMGWKPGEGLGREKTGALQPLLLDVKLDKRGLVAKDDASVNNVRPNVNKKRPNTFQETLQNFQNKHPVCILNELSSKRKLTPPTYEIVNEGGAPHNKRFLFSVQFNGQIYTPSQGSNTKKEAKMLAAKFCLEQIGILTTA